MKALNIFSIVFRLILEIVVQLRDVFVFISLASEILRLFGAFCSY